MSPVTDEIEAMSALGDTMTPLDKESRDRVLVWALGRWPFSEGSPEDPDAPRKFQIDDLPATGDLIYVDGDDRPIKAEFRSDNGQFAYELVAWDAAHGSTQ